MADELPRKMDMTKGSANLGPSLWSAPHTFLSRSSSWAFKNKEIPDQVPTKNVAVTVIAKRAHGRRRPRYFASQQRQIRRRQKPKS